MGCFTGMTITRAKLEQLHEVLPLIEKEEKKYEELEAQIPDSVDDGDATK
jgi:hypothetical protein